MEGDSWDLTGVLEGLAQADESLKTSLEPILRNKNVLSPQDRQDLLDILSEHLFDVKLTALIASAFAPLLLELFQRAVERLADQKQGSQKVRDRMFIASGKHLLTEKCGIERSSVLSHLASSAAPFQRQAPTLADPPRKKRKTSKKKSVSDEEVVRATLKLVEFDRNMMSTMWDWDNFGNFLCHKDKQVVWYACQTLARLNKLGESEKETFLLKHLSPELIQQFSISSLHDGVSNRSVATAKVVPGGSSCGERRRVINSQDLSPGVVSVCGILLSKSSRGAETALEAQTCIHQIVPVPSTKTSLQSLALAVVSVSPVLLEGPVGSGKTSYVEHVAQLTGRQNPSGLIKVQLGDQTDSKALVGTYRCTEIPGEFVWQPGPLTQAALEGKWILLEDLDYAPMDVISVLLPLLETGSLTIPGHGDTVRAAPGFQIFATQRLYSHQGGLYRQQSTHSAVLDHCWTKIRVNSLSRNELLQVITKLYPTLETVAEKLLEIFLLLCASDHEGEQSADGSVAMEMDSTQPQEQSPWKQRGNRLVSTRDLLKWCDRISGDHDLTSSQTGNRIFLEALDCFSSCLPKPEMRLAASQAIGALINIPREQARFFCQSYKPAIEIQPTVVKVGRVSLPKKTQELARVKQEKSSTFSFTQHSLVLLERIASCILRTEPVLLVGETGTGKTSTVQYLAELAGQRLKVINMNQQSDSTDLLGGYKPVDIRRLVGPVRDNFERIFIKTFSRKRNIKFLGHIQKTFQKQRWADLLKLMDHTVASALQKREADKSPSQKEQSLTAQWKRLSDRVTKLRLQVKHAEGALAFTFVEGTLVRALHDGDWILLDEINLASAETLECLSSLLEGPNSSLMLMEKGDLQPVFRHPDFRLFACMNPATDIGKKELPMGIRNRFTEFFVDELVEYQDLKILICDYLKGFNLTTTQVQNIVIFYTSVRSLAKTKLMDGTGHHPHFSLRTLCRALGYAATNPCGSIPRSLYESFSLSFLTQLDKSSCPMVRSMILKHIVGKSNSRGILQHPIPPPAKGDFVKVEGYWIASGQEECTRPGGYIITPSVRTNLKMLSRIVSARRFPVLLQGETSVGKTSLIHYLAQLTGNTCVRVNNHEHTDLQEYVGFYAADESGKLVFKEGVLVDAMRKGYWIILDELNLAPSDVLEALNRLLDDNRELFIAETQETVKAHPGFMLFATQNPPGQYGGRKILSRAFRNRFVELHFDEIPSRELETILHGRCAIPQSYCQKMVAVMLELQLRRKGSGVFAGKRGFMTLRDLFRWAERYRQSSLGQDSFHDWDQHIADEGFLLLAGKVRHSDEVGVVREVLQLKLKRTVNTDQLFTLDQDTSLATKPILEKVMNSQAPEGFQHLVWTSNLRRLAVLVGQALRFGEPVLLVGETGCGKTTICQLFSELAHRQLYSVNCHLHTETSDFLGGLRPVRSHDAEEENKNKKLFEWCDGPLVLAMKQGNPFLIDEISLADDSVLERLNSVLEPERKLLLAERGSTEDCDDVEEVQAKEGFHITATMNPGGDFGKKELSPALRNRFTEIWCEQSTVREDLVAIIEHNIREGIQLSNSEDGMSGIGVAMLDFIEWFKNNDVGRRCIVSVRDLLSWVNFINTCCSPGGARTKTERLAPAEAFIHGACLVFLDGLGMGLHSGGNVSGRTARHIGFEFLQKQMLDLTGQRVDLSTLTSSSAKDGQPVDWVKATAESFGIPPFYIPKGPLADSALYQYTLSAPTTALNALRLLRALQLPKAILLEGSPGVGKTSLVTALAKASGNNIIRINLSEQTDVTDLFGADLPVEGGEGGQFAWRDGPLLQALKAGHWIVLDELNLAPQSVLEGLNACLDHRGEIFVPEIGKYFEIQHEKTRIFACQNPLKQGGGRKGLPKSFLNRFTQVYMEPLASEDLLFIASTMYPDIPKPISQKMVEFSQKLCVEVLEKRLFGQRGGPWEFNLRDLFRWCDLMTHDQGRSKARWDPGQHVALVYAERLRLPGDKEQVLSLFREVFGEDSLPYQSSREFAITPSIVQAGYAFLPRDTKDSETGGIGGKLHLLHNDLRPLESLMKCLQMNWMAIMVGPSGSGKSTLAKLAASLTGQPLRVLAMNSAMDTTELLGGFEQTDLYRHYEELKAKAEKATIHLQGLCLRDSTDGLAVLQAVQSSWSLVCSGRTDSKAQDSSNPVDVFKEKLKRMDEHLVILKENSQDQQQIQQGVDDLLCKLQALTERVMEGDKHILGGGGQFEWVDGLLVQALQDGDWLLIDNVNFCSPSVLDRLNGLLEPNGVLTINERGIIDGDIPTIRPHRNFRLILAMDPKYGEISRAMRNRGVEICVAPEPRECDYSYMDMMTLLKGMGLTTEGSRQLIKIHTEIKKEMHDIGSISGLLLAASLSQEYLRTGRDWPTSLQESCSRVYVDSQLLKINQMNASRILESILTPKEETASPESVTATEVINPPQDEEAMGDFLASATPKDVRHVQLPSVGFLKTDSALAMARRDVALVKYLSQNIVDWNESDDVLLLPKVQHSIFDILSRASHKDRDLRRELLATLLSRLPPTDITSDMVVGVLDAVFQSSLFTLLKGRQEDYSEVWKHLQCLPVDLHGNPQMVDYLMYSMSSLLHSSAGRPHDEERSSLVKQSSELGLRFHLMMWRAFVHVTKAAPSEAGTKDSPISYSEAFSSGRLSLDDLPHPAFAHLSHFFKSMSKLMDYLLSRETPTLTETSMLQIKVSYQWVLWFQDVCHQPIVGRLSIGLLALHWGWVQRKALDTILNALGGQDGFPLEFEALVNHLDNSLGLPAIALEQIWKSAVSHMELPSPCRDEEHARWLDRLNKIAKKLEVGRRPKKGHVWKLLKFLRENTDISYQVLRSFCRAQGHRSEEVEGLGEDIEKMEKVVADCLDDDGRSRMDQELSGEEGEGRRDGTGGFKDLQMKAMLLPVQELLVLKQMHRKMSDIGVKLCDKSGQEALCDVEISSLHQLTSFTSEHPGINSRLLLPAWTVAQDKSFDHCLWTEVWSSTLASLRHSTAVIIPEKWRDLLLSEIRDTSLLQADLPRNPALLLAPMQTLHAFDLLHPKIPETLSPSGESGVDQVSLCDPVISRGVPLGCWEERLSQLREFSRMTWANSGWMNSSSQCYSKVMMKSLFTAVCWLVSSLKTLVTAGSEASWEHCMDQLRDLLLQAITTPGAHSPLLQDTVSLTLSLLATGSQSTRSNGQGRSSAKMLQGLADFHSEILKWSRNLLEGVVALTSLVDAESGEGDVANQETVIRHFQWLLCLGRCWMCQGYLQSILLAPRGPVDPAQKTAVKLECVKREIEDIEAQLYVQSKRKEILTGQRLEDTGVSQIPERVRLLNERLEKLKKKRDKLARRVAYRPQPPQYDQLKEDISHYLESIGAPSVIESALGNAMSAASALSSLSRKRHQKKFVSFLRETEGWRRSQEQFLGNLEEAYPMYRDLWAGMAAGAYGVTVGSQLIQHGIEAAMHRSKLDWNSTENNTLEDHLSQMTKFPFMSSLDQADSIVKGAALNQRIFSHCYHGNPERSAADWDRVQVRLSKLALLHISNHIDTVATMDDESCQLLQGILGQFVDWWYRFEEERKRKEEEEASLFKYKMQSHGSDETPEETEAREMKAAFPSYDKDFADIDIDPTKDPASPDPEEQAQENGDNAIVSLDRDTQRLVQTVHQYLYKHPRAGVVDQTKDFTHTVGESYKYAAELYAECLPWMAPSPDARLIGAHLAQCKIHQDTISGASRGHSVLLAGKPFDIYHDPSPSEVIRCLPLLNELAGRVDKLLEEWPDHPALKHLKLVVVRIKSFPVNSPLMKFVIGLEMLLAKAQDWQEVAAKHVSLQKELGKITELVIDWRKMELSFWSCSLDSVAYHHRQGVVKWWFHIYQVLQNMTSDPADDGSEDGVAEDWLTTLQRFLEGSTLGDFQSRLDMVLAFHYQLMSDPSNNVTYRSATAILWNLYRYYKQFVPGVEEELAKQRKPLEKELKEFVKICRWNDINFWAMKAAVEKSHKTVHKICKKFQTILEGQAKVVFTDMNISGKGRKDHEEISSDSDQTCELWVKVFGSLVPKGNPSVTDDAAVDSYIAVTFDPESLMSRLPVLTTKLKRYCKDLVKGLSYEEASGNLDDFGGEIVAGLKELQTLDITKDADKIKQKSEAKHINLRKRKALSDLFKALSALGLSYRKGLVMRNENLMTEMFSLPKIEAEASTSAVGGIVGSERIVEVLGTKLAKSENYFFLNHARKAKLLTGLEKPSKELGLPNLERCKGFSEHLSRMTLQQREKIGHMSEQIQALSDVSSQLHAIGGTSEGAREVPLPPQGETEGWLHRSKQLLDQSLLVISQYQILLDSCPANESGEEKLPSPVPMEALSTFEKMTKGSDAWLQLVGKLKSMQGSLQALKPTLDSRLETIRKANKISTQLLFWSDIDLLDKSCTAFDQCSKTMEELLRSFWMETDCEYASTGNTLLELNKGIAEMVQSYRTWHDERILGGNTDGIADTGSQSLINEKLERLLSSLLLSVQTLTQQNQAEEEPTGEGENAEPKESKNALTELLGTKLAGDITALELSKIIGIAHTLMWDLRTAADDCQITPVSIGLLLRLLPIMHHYQRLASYYFTQMVAAHKSSCKLLYVLLGIFNELAEKGFCIPAEFSDELSGEGSTEFEDIQGGGIDDGEGMKDVSDQIEDEEQVQDVKKEGEEEKDNEDQDDIKDEKEGIEMSDDFEGKMQDMEPEEAASEDEDGVDQEELDKQMGDVDKDDTEKLDEKMWGDEEDPEQEEQEEGRDEKEEEHGDGDEEEETQLVAKDDNRGDNPDEKDKDKKQKDGDEAEDGPEAPEPKALEQPFDQNEINDDEIDPSKANDPPPEPVPADLDLPDDLDLENDGEGEDDDLGEDGEMEENPLDIERPPTPIKEMEADKEDGGDGEDGKQEGDEDEQPGDEQQEMEGVEEGQDESEGVKDEVAEEDKTEKSDKPEEDEADDDDDKANENYLPDKPHDTEHIPEDAENAGKSADKTDGIQKTEPVGTEEAGMTDEKKEESEEKGTGLSETQQESGHEGAINSKTAIATNTQQDPSTSKRKPGHSDTDRSLGQEEKGAKRLKTIDASKEAEGEQPKQDENKEAQESDLYEHLKDAQSHYDVQAVDTATEDQVEEAGVTMDTIEEEEDGVGTGEQEEMPVMEDMETMEENKADKELEGQSFPSGKTETNEGMDGEEPSPNVENTDGSKEDDPSGKTAEAQAATSIHTKYPEGGEPRELVISDPEELETVRREIEKQLSSLHETSGGQEDIKAQKAWHDCEAVTSGLARELCEQLRLVLEPTQASKLRGDYRTGKRINMRKVIPYIASGFRKDKIWLRRTKPSKREYQILLAIDDSSSMADNRSREMAFESMALVSNALTWLEAGQLGVCSFGESVQLLHPFHEQFSDQSGAKILQEFTFSQKKTKIAQLLKYATSMMSVAKTHRAPGAGGNVQTSQLLLVMSDGRGLYLEGLEKVRSAVRAARDNNIFLVFLVLDNPENKDSILDIKVPVFKPDGLPDIHSYMEHFPFPFYILLRDINALPVTLSDALRQWFELVTAGDNQ